jgi:hypothetical protein
MDLTGDEVWKGRGYSENWVTVIGNGKPTDRGEVCEW